MSHERKALARIVLIVLAITFVTQILEFNGWLQSAENKVLDLVLANRSTGQPDVVTLEIDDQSYKDCFGNSSPLKPEMLLQTVNMVDKTTAATAIGIDVLTDDDFYASVVQDEWQKEFWIADGPSESQPLSLWGWLVGGATALTVRPDKVLGREPQLSPDHVFWGIPVFPADEDASIRRTYQRVCVNGDAGVPLCMPAWALTLAQRYCVASKNCKLDEIPDEARESKPLFIAYGGKPIERFQFRDVFRCAATTPPAPEKEGSSCGPRGPECPKPLQEGSLANVFRSAVKDKIVLIGGAYRAARDTYQTPLGPIPGVVINGYVIRSQIEGNFLPEENRAVAIGIDFLAGYLLAAIKLRWKKVPTPIIAIVIVLMTIVAELFFVGRQFLPGCIAMLLGMILHLIHEEHHKEAEQQTRKATGALSHRRLPL
jgi:hypothetical protein